MNGWQLIETAPKTEWGKGKRLLVWTDQIKGNVFASDVHNLDGKVWVNIPCFHGNAVEYWGVTHWMPLPAPPGAQ